MESLSLITADRRIVGRSQKSRLRSTHATLVGGKRSKDAGLNKGRGLRCRGPISGAMAKIAGGVYCRTDCNTLVGDTVRKQTAAGNSG